MKDTSQPALGPARALREHWPEYFIEAWALGAFMLSAGLVTTLLEYPHSPLLQWVPNADLRRALIGIAMGLTAIGLIYSPWGQRSGAHMNPAVTLAFWRLGKVAKWDAVFYIAAQFLGSIAGVVIVQLALGDAFTATPVHFIATVPGPLGAAPAFGAEIAIALGMMSMVLVMTSVDSRARFTGLLAGCLVALYISFEAPLSGMSMNPARSFASALPGGIWQSFWIYLTAPVLGMQLAVTLHTHFRWPRSHCAKLLHSNTQRCIHCGFTPAIDL